MLGGSQGVVSHAKLDHILELCDKHEWPLVIVAEGAGARPQEMSIGNYGRRVMSFAAVAKLSGRVPLVAIVPGRSFAGHAALAGSVRRDHRDAVTRRWASPARPS